MLEQAFVQLCYKVTTTRNSYGDYVISDSDAIPCRFRYIDKFQRVSNSEVRDSDAMLWVSGAADIANGDIILFEGTYYQVQRIFKARRLNDTAIQFIKCDLKITDINIS